MNRASWSIDPDLVLDLDEQKVDHCEAMGSKARRPGEASSGTPLTQGRRGTQEVPPP